MIKAAENELVVERFIPCGIELMPRLWSEPALISKWWGPVGFSTTTHSIDFRAGGEWRFTMHGPDGTDYENLIRYTYIDENRITYDHLTPPTNELHFRAEISMESVSGGVTKMTFKMIFVDAATKKQICDEFGAADGLYQTTERLVKEAELITLVESACSSLGQAVGRMHGVVSRVPADKLDWSPSDSARTTIHLVAHCGYSLGWIKSMLTGVPYPGATTEIGDREQREFEREFTDIETALALLDERSEEWMAYVRTLSVEDLNRIIDLPFGLGQMRVRDAFGAAAWHTNDHCAQIEYIQTILGDRGWGF